MRCAVFPAKVGELFQSIFTGSNPKIFKGAGVDFEIALFDLDGSLFDVSNVASMSVLVKPYGSPGSAAEMSKLTAAINAGLTLTDWNNGVGAHAIVSFTGTEANIAAGNHDITVHGVTSDNAVDADVFGRSVLQVIDAGITSNTVAPLNPADGVTFDQLTALLANYVTFGKNPDGKMVTLWSDNGRVGRTLGAADSSPTDPSPTLQRVDDAEVAG